jgi:hypothetical protein
MLRFFRSLLTRWFELSVTVEAVSPTGASDAEATSVRVSAANVGLWPVRVTSLTVEFLGTTALADCPPAPSSMPNTPMPATLAPGDVAHVSLDLRDIADRLLQLGARTECRLYGRCTDASGGVHRSKAWSLTPSGLAYQIG